MGITVEIQLRTQPTHPIISCIKKKKLKQLKDLLNRNNIDELYPCQDLKDCVTPLIAAVAYRKDEICTFLLDQGANPNSASHNGFTPLHYVSISKAPLTFVRSLLNANADPNDRGPLLYFTPLQLAARSDREDVMAELISAGAEVTVVFSKHPEQRECVRKISQMIHRLGSEGNELCSRLGYFLEMEVAFREKPHEQFFFKIRYKLQLEHPQTHLAMIEILFNEPGEAEEKYRLERIKWLKDTGNLNTYIDNALTRLRKIHDSYIGLTIKSLRAIFCTIEDIKHEETLNIITQLLTKLQLKERPDLWETILQTLCVITQKTKGLLNWEPDFLEQLCKAVVPFVKNEHRSNIRVYTYGVFANLIPAAHAIDIFTSVGITSVPEDVLTAADMKMNDNLKEALRRLENYFRQTNSERVKLTSGVQPFPVHTTYSSGTLQWLSISERWKKKLQKLQCYDKNNITKIGSINYVNNEEFRIAKGSDGTEVFLGLRDDGTEVAVKKIMKSNYEVLKNEERFLRLPELDDQSIVRYVDRAEDLNYGYLALQLCEYTLEEYMKNHNSDNSDNSDNSVLGQKLVSELLYSLSVLHGQPHPILHRDLKPQNLLIDSKGGVRLADFGISRPLLQDQTTCRTCSAGTRCRMAKQILEAAEGTADVSYKLSTDIQVSNCLINFNKSVLTRRKVFFLFFQMAGMLVHYILSGGHHPFYDQPFDCEGNICRGQYELKNIKDVVAEDLIKWMINEDPKNRPNVEECLNHPYLWTNRKKVEYLRRIGNREEASKCRNTDEEVIRSMEEHAKDDAFKQWKQKFDPELVQMMDKKNKAYPDNVLGLLRFIRNLHEHYPEEAAKVDVTKLFPDLFGCAYLFAKKQTWNEENPLKEMFQKEDINASFDRLTVNTEERLGVPVQESQPAQKPSVTY